MKRRLLVLLLVVALLCPLMPVSSNALIVGTESETGPWKWGLMSNNTVEIIGYTGSATNVTIPTKFEVQPSLWYPVVFVNNWTFMENTTVKKITIPSGIGVGGFGACNVEGIVFEGESTLSSSVFADCKKLKSVKLPKNLEVLPFSAFKNCVNLETVTLPDSLIEIQDDAFYGCTGLEKLHIPAYVEALGVRPFAYCTNLKDLTVEKGNETLVVDSKGVLYEKNSWGTELIFGATLAGEYTVLDGVEDIGQLAFAGATKLKKLNFPDNKVSLSLSAFDGCTALKELVFQERVVTGGKQRDFKGFTIYGPVEYKGYFQMDFPEATFCFYGKPTVTQQPDNVKAKDGEKVTFQVETDVTDASYQWQVSTNGGETWKDTSEAGNKTNTLKLTAAEEKFGRQFRCVIKDNYSGEKTISEPALLEAKQVKAKILQEPADSYTQIGGKASVKVTAEGDGLTYQWYIKDVKDAKFRKSSVTKAQYSTTMSNAVKDRQLYCVLTDVYGNTVQSKTVTLRMAASITAQPQSAAAAEGKIAKTTVKASGDGLKYQWYIKNPGKEKFGKSSVTSASYSCKMSETTDGRQAYCVITDKYGNTVKSKTVTLYMGNPAKITTQPKNAVATEGKTAKTTVKASGDGITYTWYIKNPGKEKFGKSSVTSATYSCKMSETTDGRKAYCVITDKYGTSVKTETVTFYMGNPAKIKTQPKSVVAEEGTTAKTTVKASGDGLKYQWYIKNPGKEKFGKSSVTSATYSCKMSETTDGRKAYCVITDKYGTSVKTETVTFYMGNPITITTQPKSASAENGEVVKVKVKATGDGLKYQWYIKNPGKDKFGKSSVTSATYSCKMSASTDGREVYCVITDKYGMTVKTKTVTVTLAS